MKWFTPLAGLVLVSAGAQAAPPAARDYPQRSIRMIVAASPATSNDILTRILATLLTDELGKQVIVDNRAGAGGAIGMGIAKNSVPDGHTLVSATTTGMSIAPALQKLVPYDPVNDFDFISLVAITPNVLAVSPKSPPRDTKEWVGWVRQHGTALNMASTGQGSQTHLTGTLLLDAARLKSTHVPYKAGASQAVMAGESHWLIAPAASLMGHIQARRLRGLGHTLPERSPLFPDLAPISEAVPGFQFSGWMGLIAPRKTPQPILAKLRATLLKVLAKPETVDQFTRQSTTIRTDAPEEFRRFVKHEMDAMASVVQRLGLKIE
ncbi:MAG: hypothetical protein IT529_13730 [Burkholderiales bacterium]|nr:hypothetical protein [Burkholderiales bacterium]